MSLLQVIFNTTVEVKNKPDYSNEPDDGLWLIHSRLPGYLKTINITSELLGIEEACTELNHFINSLSPAAAFNSTDNEPLVDVFISERNAAGVETETKIRELVLKTIGEKSAELVLTFATLQITINLSANYIVGHNSRIAFNYELTGATNSSAGCNLDLDDLMAALFGTGIAVGSFVEIMESIEEFVEPIVIDAADGSKLTVELSK